MRSVSFVLACSVLIAACNNAETKPESVAKDSVAKTPSTPAITPSDTTLHPDPLIKEVTTLDSIEAANNKSVLASGDDVTKAWVNLSKGDSAIHLQANIRKDHRFYGYAQPDTRAQRLILFSIFTNDVQDNPFKLRLGAYYSIESPDSLTVKYLAADKKFVKTVITDKTNNTSVVYFEKKWIDIE
ncbi:hypothetical protein HHL16_20115 [Pseudoflavitalea sp. G-6-1-2]|uniref:hypothetical protein n=1 Tax=Pseudoflavitalea sp. G-6-1-2 TaxID=2728841 RepID=UPI00146E996B|nr:hypothetical protein [Pseudoflavitalea sp. G-6-1-2]NML23194.1 hypothetical protein [Pseudoflavitalea sp. G-6-1-2]